MYFFNKDKEYKLIEKSKYFDKNWYLEKYPDVADNGLNPIKHYLEFGWKEGRNPSNEFDTNYYISHYMDKPDICPLLHYEKYGKRQKISVFKRQKNIKVSNNYIDDNLKEIAFSVIVPTYNRADLVVQTVHNILGQRYQNYEILIIDDGSNDNTKEKIYSHFMPEIKAKKIRYFYKKHDGVCKARNYGLKNAKNDWIAYIDSDNLTFPNFLYVFAQNIVKNKKQKTFYCSAISFSGNYMGDEFNHKKLLESNYIDLGTFVHNKNVYKKLGGFDENMTRLVDWDLIIRYTKKYKPLYIDEVCLLYNDVNDHARISNNADLDKNMKYLKSKHK